MGMDFSYLLYFKREKIWDVLQAVVEMASPHQPPTLVLFPDHELVIPLATWQDNHAQLKHDDPQLDFHFALYFEEDEAIQYWRRNRGDDPSLRSPPDAAGAKMVPVGYIYLAIHNPSSEHFPAGYTGGLAAFNFGTTGTRMSLLFDESPAIRKAFLGCWSASPACAAYSTARKAGRCSGWTAGKSTRRSRIPS